MNALIFFEGILHNIPKPEVYFFSSFIFASISNLITYSFILFILFSFSTNVLFDNIYDSSLLSLKIKFDFTTVQVILITPLRGGRILSTINSISGSNNISGS